MRGTPGSALLAAALLATGCRTVRAGPRDVPAVIVAPTDESRAALAAAVSAALHGAPIALARDALTRSGTLIVERSRLRDPAGLPVAGRELGTPERFRLVKRGGECLLVHERTGRVTPLEATACAPGGG